jgi:hypothetical protein
MNAPSSLSVVEPVGKAFEWTLRVLFRPLDPGKWFTIGFCAWLAFFGESGGGFHVPGGGGHGRHGGGDLRAQWDEFHRFLMANLYWIIPVVAAVMILSIALMVLFIWLSSRGKFMFLHCVAQDKAEVSWPWNHYGGSGNSLFRFRLVVALLTFVVILPFVCLAGFALIRLFMHSHSEFDLGLFLLLVGSVLLIFLLAIVCWVVKRIIEDFLVPIMYQRGILWREGWSETAALISGNAGVFILYFLFRIVLGIAAGIVVLAVVLLTCCIAGCLMLIPYIGTVIMLPILVFYRAYSAFFLAQFGPQYDVFAGPALPGELAS